MLVIRAEQLRALDLGRQEAYARRLCVHLAEKFGLDLDESLRALVQRGIGKAEGYGLITEHGTAIFLEWMVAEGESFDTDPEHPIRLEILTDPDLPEALKLEALADARAPAPPPLPLVEEP